MRFTRALDWSVDNMDTPPPRRFRFGLRTLFVLVVIAAIPCAWVGYSLNWIRERHEAIESHTVSTWDEDPLSFAEPPRAPRGLWILGETGHMTVYVWDDKEISRMKLLFVEAKVIYLDPHD